MKEGIEEGEASSIREREKWDSNKEKEGIVRVLGGFD